MLIFRCHPGRGEGPAFSGTAAVLTSVLVAAALLSPSAIAAQRHKDFAAPTPFASGSTLILGFLDHADRGSDVNRPVVQLAERLRALSLPGVYVELAGHSRRGQALKFIEAATGLDSKGRCPAEGCREVRLLLYGRGDGAGEVLKLARELNERELRVALAELVDYTGANEAIISSNVGRAANLYQSFVPSLRAPARIRAEDPQKTLILANQRFSAGGRWVDLSDSASGRASSTAGASPEETDPIVWNRVEDYILEVLHNAGIPGAPAPPHALPEE